MRKFFAAILLILTASVFALEFSDADILLPRNATPYLKFAAEDLALHLKKITGGKFNITSRPAKGKVKIVLGQFPAGFDKKQIVKHDSFAIIAKGNTLYIAGKDTYRGPGEQYALIAHNRGSKGTLYGVYSFLEGQGVRWLAPGERNTHIPRKKSIKVPEGQRISAPAFDGRCMTDIVNFGEAFMKKDGPEYIRIKGFSGHRWGLRTSQNRYTLANCHTERRLYLGRIWSKNPERFQLMKDGKRNTNYLCWTDPAVVDIWMKAADAYFSGKTPAQAGFIHTPNWNNLGVFETFTIDPMDHGASNDGRCRCKRCNDFRKKHPCADDSEIIWQVIVKVAEMVRKKYPGKYIGTLVYPPKRQVPKTVRIPDNIRVVICLPGPKKINDPKSMAEQLKSLRDWNRIVGKENIGIWTYQCELFGDKLPGVPEWYPEYFQKYIKLIRPYVRSVFHEYHAHNFTYRVLENYLQSRILWDPDVDVQKIRAEHIRLYYGPAAVQMKKVFDRMESNWKSFEQKTKNMFDPSSQIGIYRNHRPMQRVAWGQVYHKKEMAYLKSLLDQAAKAAGKSIYGERVERFHRLVFKHMEKVRADIMDLSDRAPDITLTSAPWAKQKSYKFVSAHRDGTKLTSSLRCMFRLDKGVLQARVIANEPNADAIMITPDLKNGSSSVWRDWSFEFFVYTPADNTLRQYIANAANVISCFTISTVSQKWSNAAGVKTSMTRKNKQFIWEISIPVSMLGNNIKGLKLNITHERNIRKTAPQYATFSPAALLGNWHNTDAYAKVKIEK